MAQNAAATSSSKAYELRTLSVAHDNNIPAPSMEAGSFASIREEGALGRRLEALFEALQDPERRRSLRGKLDRLEDEDSWHSLKSAVDALQEMVQSIPIVFPDFVDDPEKDAADSLSDPLLVRHASGHGFTLPFPGELASTRLFDRQWTILSSKVANVSCAAMRPETLLDILNAIFDTHFRYTYGTEACLSEFIDDGCDLGEVYGYLRPWWPRGGSVKQFDSLPAAMQARRENDHKLRSTALSGNRITNSRVPPRRVWDLYANRVLPYYALGQRYIPSNLWTVSHTWRPLSERQSVLTPINAKAWRVPIPRGTTLNAIREELLVLGAEYVFLDVLCLRQKDEHLPELENIRKREWRLDIPTIGFVYNESVNRPTIVYFNGLGLPFRNERVDPNDQFHWFNRVWTLQETPAVLIFGGLEHKFQRLNLYNAIGPDNRWPPGIRSDFCSLLLGCTRLRDSGILGALSSMKTRSYSNPVDQVACLAYLVHCPALPIYDADMDVEVAWSSLVECLGESDRAKLLFCDFQSSETQSGSWRPTWKQVQTYGRSSQYNAQYHPYGTLYHFEGSSPLLGYRYEMDAYCHTIGLYSGCRILATYPQGASAMFCIEIPLKDETGYRSFPINLAREESVILDKEYILITDMAGRYGIVAQFQGSRRVDGGTAMQLLKLTTLTIQEFRNEFDQNLLNYRTQLVEWR